MWKSVAPIGKDLIEIKNNIAIASRDISIGEYILSEDPTSYVGSMNWEKFGLVRHSDGKESLQKWDGKQLEKGEPCRHFVTGGIYGSGIYEMGSKITKLNDVKTQPNVLSFHLRSKLTIVALTDIKAGDTLTRWEDSSGWSYSKRVNLKQWCCQLATCDVSHNDLSTRKKYLMKLCESKEITHDQIHSILAFIIVCFYECQKDSTKKEQFAILWASLIQNMIFLPALVWQDLVSTGHGSTDNYERQWFGLSDKSSMICYLAPLMNCPIKNEK